MSSRIAPSDAAAPVLFIHGSLSSGRMWLPFANQFGGSRRIIMPDLIGYGASPAWTGHALQLREESRRLRTAFSGQVDIVAHSYGAAVALRLLADEPHSIRSLVLIEPSGFFLLRDLGPRAAAARHEIGALRRGIQACIERSDRLAAASRFVDYWNGPGAFSAMPDETKGRIASRINKVVADFEAVG